MFKLFLLATTQAMAPAPAEPVVTPGFDFLGNGYDMLLGNPLSTRQFGTGITLPLFNFTYNEGLRTSDNRYLRPDRTFSSRFPTCRRQSGSSTFSSSLSYQTEISSVVDATVPLPGGVQFTANSDFMRTRNRTDERGEVFVHVTSTCTTHLLRMGSFDLPPFTSNFLRGVARLPERFDNRSYLAFIEEFGTHYISEMVVGGRFGRQISYTRSTYQAIIDEDVSVSEGVTAMVFNRTLRLNNTNSVNQDTIFENLQRTADTQDFSLGAPYNADPTIWMNNILDLGPLPVRMTLTRLETLLSPFNFPEMDDDDDVDALITKSENLGRAIDNVCELRRSADPTFNCTAALETGGLPRPRPPPANSVRRICIRNQGGYVMRFEVRYGRNSLPSGNSGTYPIGRTRCIDIADTPARRGEAVSARAFARAGRRRDLDLTATGNVIYDDRSRFELHATCTGTTLRVRCRSTGIQRLLTGPQSRSLCAPSRDSQMFERFVITPTVDSPVGFEGAIATVVEEFAVIDPTDVEMLRPLPGTENEKNMVINMVHAVRDNCTMANAQFRGRQYRVRASGLTECFVRCQLNDAVPEGKTCRGYTFMEGANKGCRLFVQNNSMKFVKGVFSGKRNCDPLFGVARRSRVRPEDLENFE